MDLSVFLLFHVLVTVGMNVHTDFIWTYPVSIGISIFQLSQAMYFPRLARVGFLWAPRWFVRVFIGLARSQPRVDFVTVRAVNSAAIQRPEGRPVRFHLVMI